MRSSLIIGAAVAAISFASPSLGQLTPTLPTSLNPVSTFALPGGAFDVLPDGRLLGVTAGGNIRLQDALNSSSYTTTNTIAPPNSSGFGASFLSISPNGASVAIGDNEFNASAAVTVFAAASLTSAGPATTVATIATPNFRGDWADNNTLFVTGATSDTFTTVVNSLDIAAGTSTTVVTPAGGFSGGVAANDGTLFVGAGDTGEVRSFDASFPLSPLTFADGASVATANSAGSIDAFGSLVLIAGQQFGSTGSAFVIDQATGDSILLQPAGPDAFYGGYFNPATNQLIVTAGGTGIVNNVPAPATLALAPLGRVALRRRRA